MRGDKYHTFAGAFITYIICIIYSLLFCYGLGGLSQNIVWFVILLIVPEIVGGLIGIIYYQVYVLKNIGKVSDSGFKKSVWIGALIGGPIIILFLQYIGVNYASWKIHLIGIIILGLFPLFMLLTNPYYAEPFLKKVKFLRIKKIYESKEYKQRRIRRKESEHNDIIRMEEIIEYCKVARSLTEITKHISLTSNNYVSRNYISPLLENKKLFYTIPNHPQSTYQKYLSYNPTKEDYYEPVLEYCKKPRKKEEISKFLGIDVSLCVVEYINPLVQIGKIELTIPEEPYSSKQRFYTVEFIREGQNKEEK